MYSSKNRSIEIIMNIGYWLDVWFVFFFNFITFLSGFV